MFARRKASLVALAVCLWLPVEAQENNGNALSESPAKSAAGFRKIILLLEDEIANATLQKNLILQEELKAREKLSGTRSLVSEADEKVHTILAKIDALNENQTTLNSKIRTARIELKAIMADAVSAERVRDELTVAAQELEVEFAAKSLAFDALQRDIKNANAVNASLKTRQSRILQNIEILDTQVLAKNAQLKANHPSQALVAEIEAELVQSKKRLAEAQNKIAVAEQSVTKRKQVIAHLETKEMASLRALEAVRRDLQNAENRHSRLLSENSAIDTSTKAAKQLLDDTNVELRMKESKITEISGILDNMDLQKNNLDNELSVSADKLSDLAHTIATEEAKLNASLSKGEQEATKDAERVANSRRALAQVEAQVVDAKKRLAEANTQNQNQAAAQREGKQRLIGLEDQAALLMSKKTALISEIDELKKSHNDLTVGVDGLEEVKSLAIGKVEQSIEKKSKIDTELNLAEQRLEVMREELIRLDLQLSDSRAQIEDSISILAKLTDQIEIAESQKAELVVAAPPREVFAEKTLPVVPEVTPSTAVTQVRNLRDLPGLAGASVQTLDALATALADGKCPTVALSETFGFINRQTLVSLIRLQGAC